MVERAKEVFHPILRPFETNFLLILSLKLQGILVVRVKCHIFIYIFIIVQEKVEASNLGVPTMELKS